MSTTTTIPSPPPRSVGDARAHAQRHSALARVLRRLVEHDYPCEVDRGRHVAPLLTWRVTPFGYMGTHRAPGDDPWAAS
ncbi:hypothetical protein [Mycolicibacterium mageritense]|uniref:hypothetical protein n=1 Tax=Mycolicibacterium mageritense TaxID=53462 RepID=UPI001E547703|nr:hypothetical protein [Mycolicibacterium mageritense]MCC9182598.1 hypothetical protein [Mycolicibacterium mageritense]